MTSMYTNYTTKELVNKLKKQRLISVVHGLVIILLLVLAAFNTYKKGFSTSSLLPLCFIPMQIIIILDVKKLREEIAHRK